jgi:hypothetical protein
MITASVNRADITRFLGKMKAWQKKTKENVIKEIGYSAISIESDAKRLVPVDTGRLRASIHNETYPRSNFNYSADGKSYDGALNVALKKGFFVIGTNVNYAESVERKNKAFLFPALEKNRKILIQNVKKAIRR